MEGKIRLAVFGQKRLSREGGIEIVVKELCTRMAQNGCEVTCYNRAGHHVSGAEYDKTIEYDGIRQKVVPTIEKKGLAAVSSSFFAALYSAFKGLERPSDITIFDCYEYAKLTGKEDDDKGYSSIFVHSEKGKKVMEGIASEVECFSIDAEELVLYNGIMVRNSAKANKKRDEFYWLAAEMPINKALNQVAPITIKDYAIEKAKKFLYSTGTIKYIRKLKKKHTIAVTK